MYVTLSDFFFFWGNRRTQKSFSSVQLISIQFNFTPFLCVKMGEANHLKIFQTLLSKQNNENPKNLLLRLSSQEPNQTQLSNCEPQLDLSLRLSLGGVYNEHFKEKPITRSTSSVTRVITKKINAGESNSSLPGIFLSLTRSCSLPVDNEQGQVMLKDFQAKQRIEVQKRVLEKQRRSRKTPEEDKSQAETPVTVEPAPEVTSWAVASAAKSPALCRAIVKIKTEGYVSGKRKLEGIIFLSYANFEFEMNCDCFNYITCV